MRSVFEVLSELAFEESTAALVAGPLDLTLELPQLAFLFRPHNGGTLSSHRDSIRRFSLRTRSSTFILRASRRCIPWECPHVCIPRRHHHWLLAHRLSLARRPA